MSICYPTSVRKTLTLAHREAKLYIQSVTKTHSILYLHVDIP
uniref:Uncharacterized protein n=1 Tax=Anguilla anguilla TaxID=7936 RepID=A0A0E9WEG7_ANGAN